jgi:hypothetical protein
MWEDANAGSNNQQRIILHYLRGTFGKRCMIPSKYLCDKTKIHTKIYEPVDPICKSCNVDNENVTYWTKPLLPLLDFSLTYRLCNNEKNMTSNTDSIDLVMGGDHGQQKFRMVMKIICRGTGPNDKTLKDQHVIKIAHVLDCVHDKYNVLRDTIAPPLDNCLIRLLQEGVTVNVYRSKDDVLATKIGLQEESISIRNVLYLHYKSIPFHYFKTGDMAFNMASHWRTWCNLSVANWESQGHTKGQLYNLQSLEDVRLELN